MPSESSRQLLFEQHFDKYRHGTLQKPIVPGLMEESDPRITTHYLIASKRDTADKQEIELKEKYPLI